MTAQLDLSVVIVSHNTKEYTLAAIKAVLETVIRHTFEVIVVENMSSDGSFDAVRKRFPKVRVLRTKELVGFSSANNMGAADARGEHLLFLNSDTAVHEGAIDTLLDFMKEDVKFGAVSGQLLNSDGSIQPQGGALPNLWNIFGWMLFLDDILTIRFIFNPYQQRSVRVFQREQRNYGWLGGTVLLMPTKVFTRIEGWDDAIFLYGEDVEISLRLHKQGYRLGLTPKAMITHHRNKSMTSSARSLVGEIEGLLYIWRKHFPTWQLPVVRLLLFIGSWLRILVFGILMRDETRRNAYLEAQKRITLA
ncbi:MAG TPA: glycosyltransferase family 2 protein [Patescibacteria group bacterium]|nr:glycosyltransferase family 2 protein [Patescibacteria group bacterium]